MNRKPPLLAALLAAGFTAVAAPSALRAADEKASPVALCAITGETIKDPSKAAGKETVNGKTYYFCCGGCVSKFQKADAAGKAKFVKVADLRTEKVALQRRLKAIDAELSGLEGATAAAAAAVKAEATELHCAITGEDIASAEAAAGKREFQGKAYYFCCPGCVTKWDKDPAKAAAEADKRAAAGTH